MLLISAYEDRPVTKPGLDFLQTLEEVIRQRQLEPSPDSYTAKLIAAGPKRIAQKVGEEGVELALAAVSADRNELVEESADLLYHVLVLLSSQDIRLADVVAALEARHSP